MIERWRHFRSNVRPVDALRVVLFLPIFLAIFYYMFPATDWLLVSIALVLSLIAPYFVRGPLVANVRTFLKVTNFLPVVWLGLTFVLQPWIKEYPQTLTLVVAGLGFYIGAYFWVFSSPEVRLVRR